MNGIHNSSSSPPSSSSDSNQPIIKSQQQTFNDDENIVTATKATAAGTTTMSTTSISSNYTNKELTTTSYDESRIQNSPYPQSTYEYPQQQTNIIQDIPCSSSTTTLSTSNDYECPPQDQPTHPYHHQQQQQQEQQNMSQLSSPQPTSIPKHKLYTMKSNQEQIEVLEQALKLQIEKRMEVEWQLLLLMNQHDDNNKRISDTMDITNNSNEKNNENDEQKSIIVQSTKRVIMKSLFQQIEGLIHDIQKSGEFMDASLPSSSSSTTTTFAAETMTKPLHSNCYSDIDGVSTFDSADKIEHTNNSNNNNNNITSTTTNNHKTNKQIITSETNNNNNHQEQIHEFSSLLNDFISELDGLDGDESEDLISRKDVLWFLKNELSWRFDCIEKEMNGLSYNNDSNDDNDSMDDHVDHENENGHHDDDNSSKRKQWKDLDSFMSKFVEILKLYSDDGDDNDDSVRGNEKMDCNEMILNAVNDDLQKHQCGLQATENEIVEEIQEDNNAVMSLSTTTNNDGNEDNHHHHHRIDDSYTSQLIQQIQDQEMTIATLEGTIEQLLETIQSKPQPATTNHDYLSLNDHDASTNNNNGLEYTKLVEKHKRLETRHLNIMKDMQNSIKTKNEDIKQLKECITEKESMIDILQIQVDEKTALIEAMNNKSTIDDDTHPNNESHTMNGDEKKDDDIESIQPDNNTIDRQQHEHQQDQKVEAQQPPAPASPLHKELQLKSLQEDIQERDQVICEMEEEIQSLKEKEKQTTSHEADKVRIRYLEGIIKDLENKLAKSNGTNRHAERYGSLAFVDAIEKDFLGNPINESNNDLLFLDEDERV